MTVEEQQRMQALEAENAKLREENSGLQERLLAAQQTLAKYAKMLFGQKTERCRLPEKPAELTGSLFVQEMDPEEQRRLDKEAEKAAAEQDRMVHVAAHDRKVRKPLDTSRLEVREEHLYPELDNAEDYTEMAPEVTDSLVLVPRRMYIRRVVRHKYVLKSRLQVEAPERKAFQIAALPPAPLHKCMADASLLADIVISKYVYHLPFYRVIESYKELGVSISASTINDWFKAVYAGAKKPVFLCGDFNAEPDSEAIRLMRQGWTQLSGVDNTYSTKNPRKCIDYVFAYKAAAPVEVLSSEVLTTGTESFSDHFPVKVVVKF